MARIVPSDWRAVQASGAAAREIETLAWLGKALPDSLTVLHGVHWTRIQRGFAVIGEIDFVVMGAGARVLFIEQKSGFLDESPEGLVKNYAGKTKHVGRQIERTIEGVRARLVPFLQGEAIHVDHFLYCPDYTVRDRATAGLAPERIIDAPRRESLPQRILEALADDPPQPAIVRRLEGFFRGELELVPDTAMLVGQAEALATRLSGGLATWARRIEISPFRLRVTGTAGSGKTQLAHAALLDAARGGRRARFVCFNRPLADHIATLLPPEVEVCTVHQLCERAARARGEAPDFADPKVFDRLVEGFCSSPGEEAFLDDLVIDEGQDFEADWAEPLLRALKPEGRAWWLEDPMQRLYERTPAALTGWAGIRDETNYHSPRSILAAVNRLVFPDRPIHSACPIEGEDVAFLEYETTEQLVERTRRAITLALQAPFRKEDIAIITFSGRERSRIHAFDALGPTKLRSFQRRYNMLGVPEYSNGDVTLETVYRFKGQSAPCVILTEIDFDVLDDKARRKLFVGMTRASMKLLVVLSKRSAQALTAAGDLN